MNLAPVIMFPRITIRINIVRCIDVNEIEITVLSSRVVDALSARGLKAKTIGEFERYGTRRIVMHCLGNGWAVYSKEVVQDFVLQERARMECGVLPYYQWSITRRAAVYLEQMAECGKIQETLLRKWEAEHNPLFQNMVYKAQKHVDHSCQICAFCTGKGQKDEWSSCLSQRDGQTASRSRCTRTLDL